MGKDFLKNHKAGTRFAITYERVDGAPTGTIPYFSFALYKLLCQLPALIISKHFRCLMVNAGFLAGILAFGGKFSSLRT